MKNIRYENKPIWEIYFENNLADRQTVWSNKYIIRQNHGHFN